MDTDLKTPGNSYTVNSPMVTEQPKSTSVEQLKEIFEAENPEPKKSTRSKNKASPRKTPEKSEEKLATPTGVSSKATGQLSIKEAMMNSGRKAGGRKRGAKQSVLKHQVTTAQVKLP